MGKRLEHIMKGTGDLAGPYLSPKAELNLEIKATLAGREYVARAYRKVGLPMSAARAERGELDKTKRVTNAINAARVALEMYPGK